MDREIANDGFIDHLFDLLDFFRRHFIRMREIEAQTFCGCWSLSARHFAEDVAERLVQKVRGGVETRRFHEWSAKPP